jgi:hypothetical protein
VINSTIAVLRETTSTALHPPIDESRLSALREKHGVHLPRLHADLLLRSNGVEVYAGYYRLFGVGDTDSIDMVTWNDPATWKFAWRQKLEDYWCFAESAWGDQYAYLLDELGAERQPSVYLLEGVTMNAEPLSRDFERFLMDEFIRCAVEPYDDVVRQVRAALGDLGVADHIAYVPSLLIGGEERVENVVRMNAVASMVANGDLATQLAHERTDRAVRAVETYEDIDGRTRLRVLWADSQTGTQDAFRQPGSE